MRSSRSSHLALRCKRILTSRPGVDFEKFAAPAEVVNASHKRKLVSSSVSAGFEAERGNLTPQVKRVLIEEVQKIACLLELYFLLFLVLLTFIATTANAEGTSKRTARCENPMEEPEGCISDNNEATTLV